MLQKYTVHIKTIKKSIKNNLKFKVHQKLKFEDQSAQKKKYLMMFYFIFV